MGNGELKENEQRCIACQATWKTDISLLKPTLTRIMYTQSVPRSKHTASVIKTSQLMQYREIIAVCSQIHTKHINTLCGQNGELRNVKLAVYKDPVRTAQ